jgi:hypothetical protein
MENLLFRSIRIADCFLDCQEFIILFRVQCGTLRGGEIGQRSDVNSLRVGVFNAFHFAST